MRLQKLSSGTMQLRMLLVLSWTGLSWSYWRTFCSVVQTARVDPILSFGAVSGHVHKICGASSEWPTKLGTSLSVLTSHLDAGPSSTYTTLQNSSCSSCEIQADRSMYWTPQLYYHRGNGTVEEVRNEGMTVYYVGELGPCHGL